MIKTALRIFDRISPPENIYAHCDIPCGIYDPHLAQVTVHTVIRMTNLINELPKNVDRESTHKLARYTAVKEEHAELVKHEVRVLWGDYFKPEHVEKHPQLHELVFDTMKLASKAKQEVDSKTSKQLLENVQKIAVIFWKTKGLKPIRVKAPYPTEGEIILHK